MTRLALVLLLASSSIAAAQTTAERDALTVEQALNVKFGLEQLAKYQTTDKDGKTVDNFYRFSGDTLIVFAINIDLGRRLETQVQNTRNTLIMGLAGDSSGKVPPEKEGDFNVEWRKIMDAPSRVGFEHVKRKDLCLEVTPACKVENPIPAPVLSLIIPIVDR